jgi:GNAT superfamily N-acetyltransferase
LNLTSLTIRKYQAGDAQALTEIFYNAVESNCGEGYSPEEIRAWAPLPIDYASWKRRLEQHRPWVALLHSSPIGFISLLPDGEVGLAYVHRAFQRQGVASKLYEALENEARSTGLDKLSVEASHAAKPLFERLGYGVAHRNNKIRNGLTLVNWKMTKVLHPGDWSEKRCG